MIVHNSVLFNSHPFYFKILKLSFGFSMLALDQKREDTHKSKYF